MRLDPYAGNVDAGCSMPGFENCIPGGMFPGGICGGTLPGGMFPGGICGGTFPGGM
jgi:suppressor of tumorigenicity protein 13